MAEVINPTMNGEVVETVSGSPTLSPGSVGLETQLPGRPATVSQAAEATGGISAGNFITTDVDDELLGSTATTRRL